MIKLNVAAITAYLVSFANSQAYNEDGSIWYTSAATS